MDDAVWQPVEDSEDRADLDVEWAFFGAHDIEYWLVRDGRLVPADGSALERIAEWERERAAVPRLRRWEREQRPDRLPVVLLFGRFTSWCGNLSRRVVRVRRVGPHATESARAGHSVPRHQSDVARR